MSEDPYGGKKDIMQVSLVMEGYLLQVTQESEIV